MNETVKDISKGAVGVLASAGGLGVSALSEVEAWLRILALIAGIGVSCVTIYSILKRKKDRE